VATKEYLKLATATLHKNYLLHLSKLLYQFSILFLIISGPFFCKIENVMRKPLKWFSLRKILRIFTGLRYKLWIMQT